MDRFLLISPHTEEDCTEALKEVNAAGYITHFDWGCADGDHTGWVVLEAESAHQALLVVPSLRRRKARAVKLMKFSPADVLRMH